MNKRKGFTLVELLVVIAIIALLLSIVTPSLRKAREQAQRVICASNSRQAGIGLLTYAQNHDGKLIPNSDTNGNPGSVMAWHNVIAYSPNYMSGGVHQPMHLAVLYELDLVDNPEVFYCPSHPRNMDYPLPYYYDFYTGNGAYTWGSYIPTIEHPELSGSHRLVRVSYNYWTHEQEQLERIRSHQLLMVDNLQHWRVVPHRRGSNMSQPPMGVTAFFADGSVSFVTDSDNYIFDPDLWIPDGPFNNGPGNRSDAYREIVRRIQGG